MPGFRHDQHSMAHIFIQAQSAAEERRARAQGEARAQVRVPRAADDVGVRGRHDARAVSRPRAHVRGDREVLEDATRTRFAGLPEKAAGYMPMIAASLYTPPAPLGATYAMMDQSREGRELWRYMQMSSHDFLCQLFENDKVRMHFARVAGENLVSPDEKATGIGTFVFVGFLEAYGIGVPVGGSGTLTDALIACIRAQRRRGARRRRRRARSRVKNGRAVGAVRDGRPRVRGEGRGHRRDASARPRPDGRGSRAGGREGRRTRRRYPRSAASPCTRRSNIRSSSAPGRTSRR